MATVGDFVRSYTAEAEPLIAFAWNGKHTTEFVDSNMQFRNDVCRYFEEESKLAISPYRNPAAKNSVTDV